MRAAAGAIGLERVGATAGAIGLERVRAAAGTIGLERVRAAAGTIGCKAGLYIQLVAIREYCFHQLPSFSVDD